MRPILHLIRHQLEQFIMPGSATKKMCQKKKNEHSRARASLQLIYLLLKRACIDWYVCLHTYTHISYKYMTRSYYPDISLAGRQPLHGMNNLGLVIKYKKVIICVFSAMRPQDLLLTVLHYCNSTPKLTHTDTHICMLRRPSTVVHNTTKSPQQNSTNFSVLR